MMGSPEVAVIGAGPYGLSVAANLRARNLDFRIFGSPMESWRKKMPKGMALKSDGYATNLCDPDSAFTLKHFCAQERIPYANEGIPIALDTFIAYGQAFQKRLVPELEDRLVVGLDRSPSGFLVRLEGGEIVTPRKVVLAIGIGHFGYVPPILAELPAEFVTHSSEHHELDGFKGREVTVIGGGASAIDLAALLHEAGARVQAVARQPAILFQDRTLLSGRPLRERIRDPNTGIGPGWRSFLYTEAPLGFHVLPEPVRLRIVRNHIRPAAGWFMKDRVVGHIPLLAGHAIERAGVSSGRVRLGLALADGTRMELATDHVIAATGYKVDLRRLTFFSEALGSQLRSVEHTPILSAAFESSVPGLYFVGTASANSFGPMMRFVYGANYTARRIASHLARSATRRVIAGHAPVRAR